MKPASIAMFMARARCMVAIFFQALGEMLSGPGADAMSMSFPVRVSGVIGAQTNSRSGFLPVFLFGLASWRGMVFRQDWRSL